MLSTWRAALPLLSEDGAQGPGPALRGVLQRPARPERLGPDLRKGCQVLMPKAIGSESRATPFQRAPHQAPGVVSQHVAS